VIAGWITATLFVVPLASLAYAKQLYLASWLASTARQRIVIWGYTSSQIRNAPLLGAGVSTARALNFQDDERAPKAPGSEYRLTTGWHSHNGYLQTWYEAGAIGALLLVAFGLLVLRSLARAPGEAQPYLYATFVSCAVMAGSSFSLWAPWFMASIGFAAVFAALGTDIAARCSASARDGSSQAA
jgi:O-antigen ligase